MKTGRAGRAAELSSAAMAMSVILKYGDVSDAVNSVEKCTVTQQAGKEELLQPLGSVNLVQCRQMTGRVSVEKGRREPRRKSAVHGCRRARRKRCDSRETGHRHVAH